MLNGDLGVLSSFISVWKVANFDRAFHVCVTLLKKVTLIIGRKWKRISKHTGTKTDGDDMLQYDTRMLNVNIGSAIKAYTHASGKCFVIYH